MTFREWLGWRSGPVDFAASWIQMNIGLLFAALALTVMVKANFGMGPWGVFQVALSRQFGISFGLSVQLVGAVLLLLSYFIAKIIPSAGTLTNMYIVGFYIDNLFFPYIEDLEGIGFRFISCMGSIVLMGVGSAIYLCANQGPGPRDGLMMAIYMRAKLSLRVVRTMIEVFVLTAGWIMGGPVGIGTLLFAFLVGPILQFTISIFEFLPIRLDRASILSQKNKADAAVDKVEIE